MQLNYKILLSLILLTSCQDVKPNDYANPGDPERELVVTTETTELPIKNRDALDQLKETIKMDPPSSAELSCTVTDSVCTSAKSILIKAHITLEIKSRSTAEQQAPETTVTLFYKRLSAKNCDNRYTDNSINSSNLAQSTLGCSIRSNMMQMVTDKQQFVNPALLDYTDGEKAALNYQAYITPPAAAASTTGTNSLIGASSTSQ